MGVSYELRPEGAVQMLQKEARELTDEVKANAETLWLKLLELYNGGAHKALGYRSWRAYCAAEFEMNENTAYRLLGAGRVMDDLMSGPRSTNSSERTNLHPPLPTAPTVTRELRPVHAEHGPKAVRQAWEQAVEEFGPKPTAKQVRDVVQRNGSPIDPPTPTPSWVVCGRDLIEAVQDLVNLGADPERVSAARGLIHAFDDHLEPMDKGEVPF